MSRRGLEGRDSDSKRHRSRFDQEPSPKKSRRNGKLETNASLNLGGTDNLDRDQKRHRLQDTGPSLAIDKDSDKNLKTNGQREGTKHSSAPTEVPPSRSYFQHDDRGHIGQVGRSFSRKEAAERGWWIDSKDQHGEGETNRITDDMQETNEKSQGQKGHHRAWRHDKYLELESDQKPPGRKRPSFRERKIVVDSGNADSTEADSLKPIDPDRPILRIERREEKQSHNLDRPEKPYAGDRDTRRIEGHRGTFYSRDRSAAAVSYRGRVGNYRGREEFPSRQQYRPDGVGVEKWKHDLFDEANRSPTSKNEEDQIAKIEALLAS